LDRWAPCLIFEYPTLTVRRRPGAPSDSVRIL